MNKPRRRLLRTLAVTAVIPMALGMMGCSADGPTSNADISRQLESTIGSKVSGANGAFVHLSYSGASHRAILVVLYLSSSDADAVARAVDQGFKAAWSAAPFEPISVEVGAVVGERPAKPATYNPDALAPGPIRDALGFSGTQTTDQWIDAPRSAMIARYGTWVAPADR